MLLALIYDPELQTQTQNPGSLNDHEVSFIHIIAIILFYSVLILFNVAAVLLCLCPQALIVEYLDAACSLLFELLLLGYEVS